MKLAKLPALPVSLLLMAAPALAEAAEAVTAKAFPCLHQFDSRSDPI